MKVIPYERSFASHEKSKFWSSTNGDIKPENVYKSSGKKYKFDCINCGHTFESSLKYITISNTWCPYCSNPPKQLCDNNECKLCFDKSFAFHEKSQFWSSKNDDKPRQVFKSSGKKYWFNCVNCSHIFESSIDNITGSKNQWCPYCSNLPKQLCDNNECKLCFDRSFAFHEKSQFWSSKNDDNPRQVFKSSNKKYWFDCDKCSHTFESILNNITGLNRWCPYCSNPPKQLCGNNECQLCFDKSFASHARSQCWSCRNGEITPRQVTKSSNKKYWFNCDKCGHDFESSLNNITCANTWCPYCANKKLCDNECQLCFDNSFASHEKSQYWSNKNDDKSRQVFKNSHNKFWFDCDECGHTFESSLCNITGLNNWCPYCVNKTESKLYDKLIIDYPSIIRQFKQEWCKNISYLPFDFCIPEHNIIIELDGIQHFKQVSNWKTPEEQFISDKYKEKCANDNNYSIIRILQEDVLYDTYNWYKVLCDTIEEIKNGDEIVNCYLCNNNEYKDY
jgi:very-short-patch-repair endonuclease/uncharacterized Zn finger protein